jgi:hypothetical protein
VASLLVADERHPFAGRLAVLQESTNPAESFSHLVFKLGEQWGMDFLTPSPSDIRAGALSR